MKFSSMNLGCGGGCAMNSGCDSGCAMSSGCDSGCAMNGGWPMMNGGWPSMMNGDMGCSCGGGGGGGGGWPDEEEEEEEDEDYDEEEGDEEAPMMGWDTNNIPFYVHPNRDIKHDLMLRTFMPSKKGDNRDDFYLTERLSILKVFRKGVKDKR